MAPSMFGSKPTNVENELDSFVCMSLFLQTTHTIRTPWATTPCSLVVVLSSQLERIVLKGLALFPSSAASLYTVTSQNSVWSVHCC